MPPIISRYIEHYGASLTVSPDPNSLKFIAVLTTRQAGTFRAIGATLAEALDNLAAEIEK